VVLLFLRWTRFFLSAELPTVATLPSALFIERFVRSAQVGCSRFSQCCHLFVDLGSIFSGLKLGQAINAVTGTRRFGLLFFLSKKILTYAAAGSAL
jgi:hypothetical protein